jgi:protein TonB
MFEDVVSPHGAPAGRRRWKVGPLALGAHALVIGGALASALVNGEDLSPSYPPTPVVFIDRVLPVTLGDPPRAAGTRETPASSVRVASAIAVPREVPDTMPSSEELDDGNPSWQGSDLSDGDGPPGDPSGVPGGSPDGGTCVTCPPVGETIHELGGEIHAPRLVQKIEPEYSPAAVKLRIQGFVIVRAIIGRDGRVEDVRVEKSLFPSLDEASVAAVRQWRYEPATLRGRAVRVALTVTVRFELK